MGHGLVLLQTPVGSLLYSKLIRLLQWAKCLGTTAAAAIGGIGSHMPDQQLILTPHVWSPRHNVNSPYLT